MQQYILTSGFYNPYSMKITLNHLYLNNDLKEFIKIGNFNKNINKLSLDLLKIIKEFIVDLFGLVLIKNTTDKIFLNELSDNIKVNKQGIEKDDNLHIFHNLNLNICGKYINIYDNLCKKEIFKLPDIAIQRIDPDLSMQDCKKSIIYKNNTIKLKMSTYNNRVIDILDIFLYSDVQLEYIDDNITIIFNSRTYDLKLIKMEYCESNDRINLCVSSGISLFLMTLIGYTI